MGYSPLKYSDFEGTGRLLQPLSVRRGRECGGRHRLALAAVNPATPTSPPSIGQSGGALGYSASANVKGLANGYLGFGFDVFGNFSNDTYQGGGTTTPVPASTFVRTGDKVPGQLLIRGPGNVLYWLGWSAASVRSRNGETTTGIPQAQVSSVIPVPAESSAVVPIWMDVAPVRFVPLMVRSPPPAARPDEAAALFPCPLLARRLVSGLR